MSQPSGGRPASGSRVSRRLVIGAIGGAVLIILVLGLVVWFTRDGDDTTVAGTSTTTESRVTTTTTLATTSSTTTSTTRTSTAPPTGRTTTTHPDQRDTAGPDCVNGWMVPEPGSALRVAPLDLVRRDMGIAGRFHVVEMRYFTGPEVPWILDPPWSVVEHWYVKAWLVDEPEFRARWLVVRRIPGRIEGIEAAAPFDTTGYESPDWRGFIGEGEPRAVEGLPGTWVGMDYDFLVGEDGEKPGLPDEVVGCLDGT